MGAARGVTAASLLTFLVFTLFDIHAAHVPRSVWAIDWLLTLALVAASRMLARTIIERPQTSSIVARGKEVIVVGAGDAAQLMLREMLRTPALGYTPIGLIDDDPRKKNLRLHGIRVLGTSNELRTSFVTDGRTSCDRDPVRLGRGAPADRRGRPGARACRSRRCRACTS